MEDKKENLELEYYEIVEQPTKVYVEIDVDGNVTKVFSSDFEQPKETSILIDCGFGDKFRHAQNQYFEQPLVDENGKYQIKYSTKENENVEN